MLMGDRGGEELRQGTVCGSSLMCGILMSTLEAGTAMLALDVARTAFVGVAGRCALAEGPPGRDVVVDKSPGVANTGTVADVGKLALCDRAVGTVRVVKVLVSSWLRLAEIAPVLCSSAKASTNPRA